MDGDATTVAYTGARPGKAACSFPQGVVEMVLRSIVAVRSVQTVKWKAVIVIPRITRSMFSLKARNGGHLYKVVLSSSDKYQ